MNRAMRCPAKRIDHSTCSTTQALQQWDDAGFTHVYVHQVGPDQEAMLRLYAEEVVPELARIAAGSR